MCDTRDSRMTKIETACESYNDIQNNIERANKDPVCSDGYSNELNIVKVGPLSTTTSKVIGENALSNKMANSPVCSRNHPIEVNYKFGDKYRGYINSFYNCGSCKRYMICQPSFKCCECKEYFCFECKEEKSIGESGCISKCSNSKIIKCVLACYLVDILRRIKPMFTAIWMQVDVILDIKQTWTYLDYASPNGTYVDWAKNFTGKTNSTYEHTVSQGYFLTAMIVWFLTPMLSAVFILLKTKRPLHLLSVILQNRFELDCDEHFFCKVFLSIFLFPIDFISALVFIYVAIPIITLKCAYKILMRHEFSESQDLVNISGFIINSELLPFWMGFEFIGEAVPQLILAIVFVANNPDYMKDAETFIGAKEFETTLISIIFSVGSICMGLYSAILPLI